MPNRVLLVDHIGIFVQEGLQWLHHASQAADPPPGKSWHVSHVLAAWPQGWIMIECNVSIITCIFVLLSCTTQLHAGQVD